MSDLKNLSAEKQREFESFYQSQANKKLLPVFADFSLLSVFVGTLLHILSIYHQGGSEAVHPLNYVYVMILALLGALHRIHVVRQAAPLMVYAIFIIMSLFSYLTFLAVGGGLAPIFGVFFFLASIGFITFSIKHTLIIILINLVFLSLSSALIYASDQWFSSVAAILTNWFVVMCIFISPVAAIFSRWLYRSLYAMQFLLNDKNELLKNTFRTLKSTEEQLIHQQKHQALSHMAKGLLHEIINPVNSSMQALAYVRSINKEDDIADAIDDAMSQQQRIADIVSDLRSYAQPEENHPIESVNLSLLVSKAIKFCLRDIKSEGVEVQLDIKDDQMIDCHPTALTQVFVNLLLNACAALKQRKINNQPPVISIRSYEEPKQLIIRIKDNGTGIENAALKRISEPFYSENASPDNIGLGLSICQTVMRHHGGSINIKSQLNEWTEITLTIPTFHSV